MNKSPSKADAAPISNTITWFSEMVQHAYDYATKQKQNGRPIVGIMCEYTPREIIMAANAVPVCLCGGSLEMIAPAEQYLPANLCPLVKSTFGYSTQKANPFLEMTDLLVCETTCDGKKKMYELMSQHRLMHVMELPQKPDEPQAMEHWLHELENLKKILEKEFHTTISNEALHENITKMNRERYLRRELAAVMKSSAPPISGRQLLDLKSLISCIPEDLAVYEEALHILKNSSNPDFSDRTRVLLTGVPMPHGAERVMDLIEERGGLVVCQENCTGIKPLLEDIEQGEKNPLQSIAKKYFHLPCSVMTPNSRRKETLAKLAAEYRPDCIIEVVWQACLTYDIETRQIREFAENTLNLPYLRIETDYSPSDTARIATRIDALYESVVSRKMSQQK